MLDFYKAQLEEEAEKAIDHLTFEFSKLSTGRANPQLVKKIKINYYDTLTPIEELASITVPEAQQLLIKPFDITCIRDIVKSITNASLGLNPVDEGGQIRITFPPLTTDRKKELVRSLLKHSESAKVIIRAARQNINKQIKDNEELSEDAQKRYLDEIQKIVDKNTTKVDQLTAQKEKEIMVV